MVRFSRWFLVPIGLAAVACGGAPATDDAVAIQAPDYAMTAAELAEEIARKSPATFTDTDRDSLVLAFAEGVLDKVLMSKEARDNPRGSLDGIDQRVLNARETRMASVLRDEVTADLDARALGEMADWSAREVRVRHVQTPSLGVAREAVAALNNGAPFDSVVARYTTDAFSRARGGELPWFTFGDYPGLDEAAFRLQVGEVSEPVLSRRGWHLIRLEEIRDRADPAAAEVGASTRKRISDQRYAQRLATIAEDVGLSVDQAATKLFADSLRSYQVEAVRLREELDARREAGETLTAADYAIGRQPTFTAVDDQKVVATAGDDFRLSIRELADRYGTMAFEQLPQQYDERSLAAWAVNVCQVAAAAWAGAQGDLGAETRQRLQDAEDFVWVENLYRVEVHDKVRPGSDERRAFYDEYKESYRWLPDVTVTLVRSKNEAAAKDARTALLEGTAPEALLTRFGADSTFVVFTTPPMRDLDEIVGLDDPVEGLNTSVRALGGDVGAVTAVERLGGTFTAARLDHIGEETPMTYEEAEPFVAEHCIAYHRELRLRAVLDSLRVVHGAAVDSTVVLGVKAPSSSSSESSS